MKATLLSLFVASTALAQAEGANAGAAPQPAPVQPETGQSPPAPQSPQAPPSSDASTQSAPTANAAYDQPVAPLPPKCDNWYDRIKLSGRTYLRYSWDVSSNSNFNEFAIDRIYLQSEYQISERFRVQVTLEAGDIRTSGTGNFQVAPKYAFLEFKDPLWKGTYVRAGLVHTPWIAYEEDLWGFRVEGKIFFERAGYGTSSDLGLLLGGKFPEKLGSFQVAVTNGEGWKAKEIGKGKELAGRVTVNPFAMVGGILGDVFVSAFADWARIDSNPDGADTRIRYVAQVGIASHDCLLAADYVGAKDQLATTAGFKNGQGASVFGVLGFHAFTPNTFGNLQLFGRFDWLDPDAGVANDELSTVIGGVAYRINSNITALLDYEQLSSASPTVAATRRVQIQAEARF
jgi:hypothetical protein